MSDFPYELYFPRLPFPAFYDFLATTPWKQAVFGVTAALMFLSLAGVMVAWFNSKYAPFKCKCDEKPSNAYFSQAIGSCSWMLGALYRSANHH